MNDKTAGVTAFGYGDGERAPERIARDSQLASQLYFQGNLAT